MEDKKEFKFASPRERLILNGAGALADYELLAIVLRIGSNGKHVLTVAQNLYAAFGTLFELKDASLEELQEIKGIGQVKALEIKAVIELGRRLVEAEQVKFGQVCSSQGLGELLTSDLKDQQQEHLVVVYLNNRHEIIKKRVVFIGSLTESVAHPREIFNLGIKCRAAKLVIAHNHPSGNLEPSNSDLKFTKRMEECGELIGIPLLDHFIVSSNGYFSFREQGILK